MEEFHSCRRSEACAVIAVNPQGRRLRESQGRFPLRVVVEVYVGPKKWRGGDGGQPAMAYSRQLLPSGLDILGAICSGAIMMTNISEEDACEDFGGQFMDGKEGIPLALEARALSMEVVADGSECDLHDFSLALQLRDIIVGVRPTDGVGSGNRCVVIISADVREPYRPCCGVHKDPCNLRDIFFGD